MNTKELIIACREQGMSVRKYSGRGMYGDYCVGFVDETEACITADLIKVASKMFDSSKDMAHYLIELLSRTRTDQMGRDDIIMYFPRLEWPEDMDEEDEDEEA